MKNPEVPPVLLFNEQGHAWIDWGLTNETFREPICPECSEPIRWVLDMYSATTGSVHYLAHARCVWRKEAFRREEERAADDL